MAAKDTLAQLIVATRVAAKSASYGILSGHAYPTMERVVQEEHDHYFSKELYRLSVCGTIGTYLLGAGYLASQHGWKGALLAGVPLVTQTISSAYEKRKHP